jgi:hypothetical protein
MALDQLREKTPSAVLDIADHVWKRKNEFIRWPKRAFLFMPGVIRTRYHQFTEEQRRTLRDAAISPDRRSNGPAIMAYRLAGGERPVRVALGREWSIHHIYDGQFPWPGQLASIRAVIDGKLFTEAAGLVAIHPIADALADEVPYFAWLLRLEAFKQFGFDPDGVFRGEGDR